MAENFIERRKESWRRLEELTEQAKSTRGLRLLARHEVRELGRSYRRAAADLAIARVESRDTRLISYLNNLVIHAHGMIYRSEGKGFSALVEFFRDEFPAVARQTKRYTVSVIAVFLALALFSGVATWRNDDFAEFAYLNSAAVQDVKTGREWWKALNNYAPVGAAQIMANNIGVTLRTFALSIIPIVGTVEALRPTGLQFGAINALAIKYKMKLKLYAFVSGHGVLEFAAIFFAGGAGLMLGWALLVPGERTRREALIEKGELAIKLLAGCIPLLIIAGTIEGFVSPSRLHWGYKFAVSLTTAIGLAVYLTKPDNRVPSEQGR
jgi:uncharacterized membrane protein SpoIIM required for sporulation